MRIQRMYKIHGTNVVNDKAGCYPNNTKFYETYDEALRVAETCAKNAVNVANDLAFIIFEAIVIIRPVKAPIVRNVINKDGSIGDEIL